MSKLRKILIALLAVCITVCTGVALAACNNDDSYINPDEQDGVFRGKYVITVQSRGGLGLNNVKVSAEKNGVSVADGISTNGNITFNLDPDEYDIVVDESSLPAGYTVAENTVKTSAENGDVKITADSSVILSPAPAGTTYKKGNVMYDFSFEDAETGDTYTLSEEFKSNKKAVMLNFWGTTCNPCVSEFPAIQKAYESYSDKIEIFALSSYGRDTDADVVNFKTKNNIKFPMAVDYGNIYTLFSVSAYPTTVIIDRYGVVAYISSGSTASESAWKALFNKYTAASYSQGNDISEGDDGELIYEERPDGLVSPDSAAIAQALAGEGTTIRNGYFAEEDVLAWPWKVDGDCLSITNSNAGVSYSVVRFDILLEPLQGISFRYNANTLSNRNVLYLIIDGTILWEFSENSNGWQTHRVTAEKNGEELYYSRSTRVARITLMYMKVDTVDEDTPVSVDDFTVYNITDVLNVSGDFGISAVDGLELVDGKYGKEGTDANDEQALYYYDEDEDLYYTYYIDDNGGRHKTLLVADVNQITVWTDLHYGDYYFYSPEENSTSSYAASLYYFSYWYLSNWEETKKNEDVLIKLDYDEDNIIFLTYTLQQFSESGYVPINKKLHDILIEFTKEAYANKEKLGITGEWYEDQWLELCYYLRHYGDAHKDGEVCFETYNTAKGLAYSYAYDVTMDGDEVEIDVTVEKAINYYRLDDLREAGGGIKFKFVPEKDGVYLFYSSYDTNSDVTIDPSIMVVDLESNDYLNCFVVDNDDDVRYNKIHLGDGNFYYYAELKASHTYGITATISSGILLSPPIKPESYTLHIEYAGTYAEMLRVCSYGGFWTWTEDEDGNPVVDNNGNVIFDYVAIPTILVDGKYYEQVKDENGNIDTGEKIYIDFVNPTYYEYKYVTSQGTLTSGFYSIKDLIYGVVSLDKDGKPVLDNDGKEVYLFEGIFGDNTDKMIKYYEQALESTVTVNGEEIKGLLHATKELVEILSAAIGESVQTSDWEQFACYKQTFGTK